MDFAAISELAAAVKVVTLGGKTYIGTPTIQSAGNIECANAALIDGKSVIGGTATWLKKANMDQLSTVQAGTDYTSRDLGPKETMAMQVNLLHLKFAKDRGLESWENESFDRLKAE
jgi:hypothetical protein